MKGRFFDTNVLVYLASADVRKADIAQDLLAGGGTISVQVLNELANVARRKMGLSWGETQEFLAMIRSFVTVVPLTLQTHELGLALAELGQLLVREAALREAVTRTRQVTLAGVTPGVRLLGDGLLLLLSLLGTGG